MTRPHTSAGRLALSAFAAGAVCASLACSHDESEVVIANPFKQPVTFAVAPVLNFSGQFDLDPITAADLLASELSSIEGVSVLPLNRVVAFLATQGKQQIESPAHALVVAEAVGADALLVAGITEYDPYTPILGVVLQMYATPGRSLPTFDPVAASRQPQALNITEMADPLQPAGQVQRVYNGNHAHLVEAVRRYASGRSDGPNPLGWRQYLKVQTLFLRFCWYDAAERLMRQAATNPVMDPEQTILARGILAEVGE